MLNSISSISNPNLTINPPPIITDPTPHYAPMLKESIHHFLAGTRRGSSDFSSFRSIFFRLFQTMPDPPLEVIWFYSAITYHSSKSTLQDPSKELLIAKDLFHLLVSCSSPCDTFRKVAVLAPVVYEVYNLVCAFTERRSLLCSKRDIAGLIEGIISYISMCCSSNYFEEHENVLDNNRILCFFDLVRVWTVDRVGESCKFWDNLGIFLPLLSEEICRGVNEESGVGYLAGVVMIEVFLLSLCLKFGPGVSMDELQRDIRIWAVQIIKGFHNCYFLDMLLRVLLEPNLPVTTLLKSEDEVLLRKVLYDSVLLEEYSFLSSARLTQLPSNDLKNLSLVWLFAADNGIQFVRENGDHIRAISYIDAFSRSHLPNLLIKWVTSQNGMDEKLRRPKTSTPKALIKWLLVLEDQGVTVFDENISKFHAKAVICKPAVDYELPEFKQNGENRSVNSFFHIGNEVSEEIEVSGDQEMVDSLDHDFSAEVSTATNGRRKREDGLVNEGLTRIKLVKYNVHQHAT